MILNTLRILQLLILLAAFVGKISMAQSELDCGSPPRIDDVQIKGQIAGKASALSKFIGSAELTGEIEVAIQDIFSKYKEEAYVRGRALLQYLICRNIVLDKNLSDRQRRDEFVRLESIFIGSRAPRPLSSTLNTFDITNSEFSITEFLDINGTISYSAAFSISKNCQIQILMPKEIGFKVALEIQSEAGTRIKSSIKGIQNQTMRLPLSPGKYRVLMRTTRDAGMYTANVKAYCPV